VDFWLDDRGGDGESYVTFVLVGVGRLPAHHGFAEVRGFAGAQLRAKALAMTVGKGEK